MVRRQAAVMAMLMGNMVTTVGWDRVIARDSLTAELHGAGLDFFDLDWAQASNGRTEVTISVHVLPQAVVSEAHHCNAAAVMRAVADAISSVDAHQPDRPSQVSTTGSPWADFMGLRIEYDTGVLTPRPWTAVQSEWAADIGRAGPPGPILELCSGAGQIGLYAATLLPRPLVCVDADPVACRFLRRNAAAAGLAVDVREAQLDSALDDDERFALIIADPPWVSTDEVTRYPDDPVGAIDGGTDGLQLVELCLVVIDRHLAPAGSAVLQVGPRGQARRVRTLVEDHPRLTVVDVREFADGALVHLGRAGTGQAAG